MPLWQQAANSSPCGNQTLCYSQHVSLCTAGGCRFSCMVWVWYTTGVPTNITKQPRARCHTGSLVQARSLLPGTYRATQAAPRGKA